MNNIEGVAKLLVASAIAALQPEIAHPVVIVFIRDPNERHAFLNRLLR